MWGRLLPALPAPPALPALVRHFDQAISAAHVFFEQLQERGGDRARLSVTDRRTYDPTRTAVYLLSAVQAVHPDRIGWIPPHFDRLAGGRTLREAIVGGQKPEEIVKGWEAGRRAYEARRRPYLLYP